MGNAQKYETKTYMQYSLATDLNETPEDLKDRKWEKDKKGFNTLPHLNSAYWVKLQIKNSNNSPQTYYLKSEKKFTYKIDYYLVVNKKVIKHLEDGVSSKSHSRPFNSNHILFPLTIDGNSTIEVYFKIKNYNKISMNFTLVTQEYLLDYYQTYNMLEGIFFGGMLLMILYNLFIYFLLLIPAYLYYVIYVLSLNIYFIGFFGFYQRYLESYTYIFHLSSGTSFIFLTFFVQSILNLKEKLPNIHKILNLFIIYFILITLINWYLLETKLFIYAQLVFNINFLFVSLFILIIISSTYYLAYSTQDTIAKFYSISWSIMAIVGLLLPLQYLNIINIDIPSDYIFQLLILIEVLLFSFILAYKMNLIEREKKEQEELLVQQNKLASMGEVITMIAHQWRQPLSEINGIILNMDVDYQKKQLENQKFTAYLDNIEATTNYMSQTINNFIDYFKHTKEKEEFTVSALINGALNIASSSRTKSINIEYLEHPEIRLFSFRSELTQAILIVLNNAIDACSASSKPNLDISISVTESQKHIILSIQDNGIGIPPEIMEKIYDPYFTTKHKSQGTGLGLYILKMIIEQTMQGKIEISSNQEVTKCDIYILKM